MRAGLLVAFLFVVVALSAHVSADSFIAGEKPASDPSPDGKWLFEAIWFGTEDTDAGWLTDIKETATGRVAMQDPKPTKDEMLPHRLATHWSSDSRHLAIDCYYGRIVFGFSVLTLDNHGEWVDVPLPGPGHPRHMIAPADRGRWVDGSDINTSTEGWSDANTLQLTDSMRATMVEPDGAKEEITSTRQRLIRLTGKTARTVSTSPPDYDELGH